MIKKFSLLFFLLFSMQQIFSQGIFTKERLLNRENHDKSKYRWGYYLGLNSLDFKIDYIEQNTRFPLETQDIVTQKNIGFNVGLIGNLRINDYVDVRTEPGVIFSSRNLFFPNVQSDRESQNTREIQTTAVYIPILLKLSTKRLNNFKPFIVGGVSTAINLSSNEDNPDDNSVGEFRTTTNTYNYEIGFGIDFFLPYFKFTPSIRGIFSMTNEVIQDNENNLPSIYTTPIEELNTRGVFLNFTFQ